MTVTPIRIQSGGASMTQYRTFCSYGDTRCGKTRWGGTFPNALFIADASERGWITLETMPPEEFYHAGQGPVVLPVSEQGDMIYALDIAEKWVRAGYIDSVIIDSLTFYAESWFQHELQKMIMYSGGKSLDTRSLYGALANHLSTTRQQIHKWPCHVVWTALAAAPDDDNPGGPMVAGRSRRQFPAGCDHIFYHRKWTGQDEEGKEVEVFETRTRAFGKYLGGGRDSGLLPDPVSWPTFRLVAGYLGLPEFPSKMVPEDVLRAAVQAIPSAATAAAASKPTNTAPTVPVVTRPPPGGSTRSRSANSSTTTQATARRA